MGYIDKEAIANKAAVISEKAGVTGQFPINLQAIAEILGFSIETFPGGIEADGELVSGAIEYKDKIIYVNGSESPARTMFTAAHEIGHAMLHSEDGDRIDFRGFTNNHSQKESEANHFAACVLMPQKEFLQYLGDNKYSINKAAKFFGVSEQAAKFRAENLGVISIY